MTLSSFIEMIYMFILDFFTMVGIVNLEVTVFNNLIILFVIIFLMLFLMSLIKISIVFVNWMVTKATKK